MHRLTLRLLDARMAPLDPAAFRRDLDDVAVEKHLYKMAQDVIVGGIKVRPLYVLVCCSTWEAMYRFVQMANKWNIDLVVPMRDGISPAAALWCAVRAKTMHATDDDVNAKELAHLEAYLYEKIALLTADAVAQSARQVAEYHAFLAERDLEVLTGELEERTSQGGISKSSP